MPDTQQRRRADEVINRLEIDVRDLKIAMQRNTEITEDIRDVLASFRVVKRVAGWIGAIAAAVAASFAAIKGYGEWNGHK